MRKYISKGVWFEKDTEARLIAWVWENSEELAFFVGIRDGKEDEKVCDMDEFNIVDA